MPTPLKRSTRNGVAADPVECYLKTLSKRMWPQPNGCKQYPRYRNRGKLKQAYYFEEDTALSVFVAEFEKVAKRTEKQPRFRRSSIFRTRTWAGKNFKETDAASEVQRARKAPALITPRADDNAPPFVPGYTLT